MAEFGRQPRECAILRQCDLLPTTAKPNVWSLNRKLGVNDTKTPTALPEFSITIDGGEFYSFVRTLKRGYRRHELGEVVISVRDGKLTMETQKSGCILPFPQSVPPVVAHVKVGNFCALASLVKDAHASGPLTITFRPELGEIGLPHIGTRAKFEHS